jgi:AcrR family transcriptional regulator
MPRPRPPAVRPRRAPTRPAAPQTRDTRQRLIETALRSFSEQGIEAVSIRTVTAAAGQANQTAVHYYFKDKPGLVAAVLEQIGAWLAPMQQEVLRELQRDPDAIGTVRDLVKLAYLPFIAHFTTHPQGPLSIRFLSRLTWQSGGEGQALLVELLQPYFSAFRETLVARLPDKPPEAIAFHLYLAVNNLIHGLADLALLGQRPVPEIAALYAGDRTRMLDYFYDYVAGGLASLPVRPQDRR